MNNKFSTILTIALAIFIIWDTFILEPAKFEKMQKEITDLENQIANSHTEEELAVHMNYMQLYMNKLWFAGSADNFKLAGFYTHELEEIAEDIVKSEIMEDGHDISNLMKIMLLPAIKSLEDAVKEQNTALFKEGYTRMVNTCNACHTTTEHEFIKIIQPKTPVFDNQDYQK